MALIWRKVPSLIFWLMYIFGSTSLINVMVLFVGALCTNCLWFLHQSNDCLSKSSPVNVQDRNETVHNSFPGSSNSLCFTFNRRSYRFACNMPAVCCHDVSLERWWKGSCDFFHQNDCDSELVNKLSRDIAQWKEEGILFGSFRASGIDYVQMRMSWIVGDK